MKSSTSIIVIVISMIRDLIAVQMMSKVAIEYLQSTTNDMLFWPTIRW